MPIQSGKEYIQSLKGRNLKVYLFGELIKEPVDHPIIRPSINAMARTYDLANEDKELATAYSPIIGKKVNRFLHIPNCIEDLVRQNKMQRKLGQLTGTCFQRCVGMDAINALYSTTFDIDAEFGTEYHKRLIEFIKLIQGKNLIVAGAMTDTKGDRSKTPAEQDDPDLYLHVVKETPKGVFIKGAKAHITGCINSHWIIVMPTRNLQPTEKQYAIVGAVSVDEEGITYIYGRQPCDTRATEEGDIDIGNSTYSGQEVLVIFNNVFIPRNRIFMNGETKYTSILVERFSGYHRKSYSCKTGVGDVLIGAAATISDYHGVSKASHIKDKLVEMIHLNETIYSSALASSYEGYQHPSGIYINNNLLANVCKHNVTRFTTEIGRLAQDLAGGILVTLPSDKDFNNPEIDKILNKYLKTKKEVSVENRRRILRLIENLTMGRNAVGYLTESIHGAGSPQAQRIMIFRQAQIEYKKKLAELIAKIQEKET